MLPEHKGHWTSRGGASAMAEGVGASRTGDEPRDSECNEDDDRPRTDVRDRRSRYGAKADHLGKDRSDGKIAHQPRAAYDRGERRDAARPEAALHAPRHERSASYEDQRLPHVDGERRRRRNVTRRVAPPPCTQCQPVDWGAHRGEHQGATERARHAAGRGTCDKRGYAEAGQRHRQVHALEA